MTAFRYTAVDRTGALIQGDANGDTREIVLERLCASGHTPVSIRTAGGWSLDRLRVPLERPLRATTQDLLRLTQSLQPLLKAGLHLDRGLSILLAIESRRPARLLLERLVRLVREGRSFADALGGEVSVPPYYAAMIRAGEMGGSLPEVVERLASFLDRSQRLRERLRSALIYPALLAAMIVATLTFLVAVVLPRFEQMFAESHAVLPLATRIVLGVGSFFGRFGWLLALLSGLATAAIWRQLKRPLPRLAFDRWLLRSRLSFGLVAKSETSRFLRTLGTLIANGVPATSALRVARDVLSNRALGEAADRVIQRVREGESLAAQLTREPSFPAVAGHLARVGEETGRLDRLLLEAADVLDRDVELTTERALALLVPAITIGMGVLVAGLIGSVLVGILSVNDLAY